MTNPNTNQKNDVRYYTSSGEIAKAIQKQAMNNRIIVPFRPPVNTDKIISKITADMFEANDLYSSIHKYGNKDFMTMQMKRIGFSGKSESFDEPVLTVYGMMMTGLVTVANEGTQSTHIYTLNQNLAIGMCGKAAVQTAFEGTKEHPENVKKNCITCFEIIPQRAADKWVYDCQPALYECKKNQTVTYTLSILYLRNKLYRLLLNNVVNIQYYDIKEKTVKDIYTSLSASGLSGIMEEKVYMKIMKGVIDEKKMATLKLPVLNSEKSGFAEIFIPSVAKLDYKKAGLIVGNKFDPFDKN